MYRCKLFVRNCGVHCFCHSGGFEGQVAWFFALLPGAIPIAPLSDYVDKLAPSAERVSYWVLFISFNFGWYWGISYANIRTFHASGWELGSPEF